MMSASLPCMVWIVQTASMGAFSTNQSPDFLSIQRRSDMVTSCVSARSRARLVGPLFTETAAVLSRRLFAAKGWRGGMSDVEFNFLPCCC